MTTSLTIRVSPELRRSLRQKARLERKSESAVARELLDQGLNAEDPGAHLEEFCGCVSLPKKDNDPWRRKLRERNWRQ